MDSYFRVDLVAKTPKPQQVCWVGMHQCVCEGVAIDDEMPDESKAGELIVKHLLAGDRGHYSPIEAPQITFNVAGFPHSVIQQATRHRVAVHFSVQSFRYTGQRVPSVWEKKQNIEEVFYLRPVGDYHDRSGKKYHYSKEERESDIGFLEACVERYRSKLLAGYSEEHARGLLPFDIRQNFVVSFNARSLMHFLDLRAKQDAQLEIVQLCELIWPHFEAWMPEVAGWYKKSRYGKARLAP